MIFIFIFTPTKLKRKTIFVALRINKKFTFYCDKLSIETKKVPNTHTATFDIITLLNKVLNNKLNISTLMNFTTGRAGGTGRWRRRW